MTSLVSEESKNECLLLQKSVSLHDIADFEAYHCVKKED